jgi:hypothetical protein
MTCGHALIGATALAIALTSFEVRPAAAASDGPTAAQSATKLIAARRVPRGNPAVPLAAFGALASAMTSLAAAEHRRETYHGPYYTPYSAPYAYEPYRRPLVTRPVAGRL